MTLLEKVRKLNEVLQAYDNVNLDKLAEVLSTVENANVYCANEKGVVLGYKQLSQCADEEKLVTVGSDKHFPELYTRYLANVIDTDVIEAKEEDSVVQNTIIVPLYKEHQRIGTMVMELLRKEVKNDDLILAEFASTVLGAAIMRATAVRDEQKNMVNVALETLSYSEGMAVKAILKTMEGNLEGYIVASKIADESKITRSVIVNAMRKLESAGVIETRSLGMKGTYIHILVPMLVELGK